jgi:hypothetical protein
MRREATVTLFGNYTSANGIAWSAVSDGKGGADITDPPAAIASVGTTVDTVATTNGTAGTITFANTAASGAETVGISPEGSDYIGNFSVGPVTGSNGIASIAFTFSLGNDQIKFAPGETVTQSYGIITTEGPQAVLNQTVSVSIGGPSNDNFVFQPGIGADTIINFNPHVDTIELDKFANVQTMQQLASLITSDAHGDAMIELGHNDSITIPGLTQTYLQAHLEALVRLHG